MEIYYEKNVVNDNIDKKRKRTTTLQVCRIVCIALLFIFIFNVLSSRVIITDKGTFQLIMSILMIVITIGLPAAGIVIFTLLINRFTAEYDYVISGTVFRIVKVINRNKRKKMLELPLDAFSAVGMVDSESYKRHISGQAIKLINACCDESADKAYIFITRDGERKILIIEVDKSFLFNLKRASNPTIFDDSVNKYLSKKESVNDIPG